MVQRLIIGVLLVCLSFGLAVPAVNAQFRTVPESREQVQLSYAPVVKQVAPAVVNIFTKRTEKVNLGIGGLFSDPMMRLFLDNALGLQGLPQERVTRSLGSGVIVSKDGLVVTNRHVIEGSDQIRIVLHNRREFDAEILVEDEKTDLAVLKIQAEEAFPYLQFRDSDDLEVGDLVLAIGNPFGIGQTVTSGIVSALARTAVGVTDYQFFIQTDAAINPGNSGGALVTLDGRLIGINTAIYTRSGGSNGIGFATPSNIVQSVVASADGDGDGTVTRPWFGAAVQTVSHEIAESLGLQRPIGVLLQKIIPGSPAEKAGLKVGDVVLMMDGKEIQDAQALNYRVATYAPGEMAKVAIIRDSDHKEIFITLEAPAYDPPPDRRILKGNHPLAGAAVANLSPGLAFEHGVDLSMRGVMIEALTRGSSAVRLGVRPGDVVRRVNLRSINTVDELESALNRRVARWEIILIRDGREMVLTVGG